MKLFALLALFVQAILLALFFVPQLAADYGQILPPAALACGLLALMAVALKWDSGKVTAKEPQASVQTAAPTSSSGRADADIAGFLAILQEKGRLVDFLMDDITPYKDAQVGAAARVVHEGCRGVLKEYFDIQPVNSGQEGGQVTVEAHEPAEHYRVVGKASSRPFTGSLLHKGWITKSVRLPKQVGDSDRLPVIAPAEVEVK